MSDGGKHGNFYARSPREQLWIATADGHPPNAVPIETETTASWNLNEVYTRSDSVSKIPHKERGQPLQHQGYEVVY